MKRSRIAIWCAAALVISLLVASCQQGPTAPGESASDRAGGPATPFENPTPIVTGDAAASPCGGQGGGFALNHTGMVGGFVEWDPSGSYIIFEDETRIMSVDVGSSQLQTIVDANPGYEFYYLGLHADMSPDGSSIAYTSCEYKSEVPVPWGSDGPGRERYIYEIATVAVDGTGSERLTENVGVDHFPAWSPDMTRIAFITNPRESNIHATFQLVVMSADGSNQRLPLTIESVAHSPAVWSPNGQHIGFLTTEREREKWGTSFLYIAIVGSVGSGLRRISEAESSMTWSPDGQRLAFMRPESGGATGGDEKFRTLDLVTVAADGSDPRMLAKIGPLDLNLGRRFERYIMPVIWSPDGAHIVYVCNVGVCIVDPDGNPVGQSPAGWVSFQDYPRVAWSRDGSRVAIRLVRDFSRPSSTSVFTMAPDGSDVQVLVKGRRKLVAPN